MSINYPTLVSSLENIFVDASPSGDFSQILPQAIAYSENRIYREIDTLSARRSDLSVTLTPGSRNATCPSTISVVEGVNILTPAGQTPPTASRTPLERTSIDFIDFAYGAESVTGTPSVYALRSDTGMIFAPTPASAWKIEIIGTDQPSPMSSTNPTTWLGDNLSDLFLAGCCIFLAGWQQNYGAQSDNSGQAVSWESQYQTLKSSAAEWIQRQKSQDPNWTPFTPTPLSSPRT